MFVDLCLAIGFKRFPLAFFLQLFFNITYLLDELIELIVDAFRTSLEEVFLDLVTVSLLLQEANDDFLIVLSQLEHHQAKFKSL